MSSAEDQIRLLFRGEGPLLQAMLAERARELAAEPQSDRLPDDEMAVLTLATESARWALPVAAVARVEPLCPCLILPDQPPAVLGLALLAGRRCLVADLAAMEGAAPRRPSSRSGHAVLLRDSPLALAVDRAETIRRVPRPLGGGHMLADGSLLLDAARLAMTLGRGGGA